MATNDNYQLQIHIVSSVKGGCGKTAFSLFKAMELAYNERERIMKEYAWDYLERSTRVASVLWLDADFKGTGSKALLYGKSEKEFESINHNESLKDLEERYPSIYDITPNKSKNWIRFDGDYVPYTINDYLRGNIRELEKMIVRGHAYLDKRQKAIDSEGIYLAAGINGFLDFIFSSSDAQDKKIFQYGGSLPTVAIGRFMYYMQRILAEIYEMGIMNTRAQKEKANVRSELGYKHIILDMPPGDDSYSEALLDMIYKWASKQRKGQIKIHYYLATTSDKGHVTAMLDELGDIMRRLNKYPSGEEVELSVVLGEIREGEFENTNVQERVRELHDKEKVRILKCNYQQEYYEFCRADYTKDDSKKKWFTYNIEEVD